MEEFTILFGSTNEPVQEGDYFFSNLKLERAIADSSGSFENEALSKHKKAIPVLCSKSLGIGDKVLIDSGIGVPATTGKAVSINWKDMIVTVETLSEMEIDSNLVQSDQITGTLDVDFGVCFFPIIEVRQSDESATIKNHQKITREQMDFITICSKCSSEVRMPEYCDAYGEECGKKIKQQLAIIK